MRVTCTVSGNGFFSFQAILTKFIIQVSCRYTYWSTCYLTRLTFQLNSNRYFDTFAYTLLVYLLLVYCFLIMMNKAEEQTVCYIWKYTVIAMIICYYMLYMKFLFMTLKVNQWSLSLFQCCSLFIIVVLYFCEYKIINDWWILLFTSCFRTHHEIEGPCGRENPTSKHVITIFHFAVCVHDKSDDAWMQHQANIRQHHSTCWLHYGGYMKLSGSIHYSVSDSLNNTF